VLKEGEKLRFWVPQPAPQFGELPCAEKDGREDGAKDSPPQRRYHHAGNLRSQHERGSSCSARRDAGGGDDAVKCGELRLGPRTESLVAAALQWAERIMWKIDGHLSEIGLRSRFFLLDVPRTTPLCRRDAARGTPKPRKVAAICGQSPKSSLRLAP